jgi:hypothetical protein
MKGVGTVKPRMMKFAAKFAAFGFLMAAAHTAQAGASDVKVSLALNKSVYLLADANDKIEMTLEIENQGAGDVITSAGFSDRPFHLLLLLIDPNGKSIAATLLKLGDEHEGPNPRVLYDANGNPVQVEAVEILPGTANPTSSAYRLQHTTPNLREYYAMSLTGYYTVKAVIPFRTYNGVFQQIDGQFYALLGDTNFEGTLESNTVRFALVGDGDSDGYAYPVADSRVSAQTVADCDDRNAAVNPGATEILGNGLDDDCNPATPDVIISAPLPTGTIALHADLHTVGSGSKPGSSKEPIVGLPVRAFDRANPCVARYSASWHHYGSIWRSCIPAAIGLTNNAGDVSLAVAPGDYSVIGEYPPGSAFGDPDNTYLGVSAGGIASNTTTKKYLQVIVKSNGQKVPAKYTKKTGSELLIIEPEYIEWNGTEEIYPFVFDSVGEWSVTTSVEPPEGFVSDHKSLSAAVNSSLAAVQFTITDVGSKWVDTKVKHKIKHRGRSEVVQSKVGVKLSKALAKKKGKGPFGDADVPTVKPKKSKQP